MEKRRISAGEIVREIRAGTSDWALMQKYKLSVKGLESLYLELMAGKVINGNVEPGLFIF